MTILRVFLPFAFGFFLSYLYRIINAVIAPDLVRDLGVDAADLGLLTSAYFLAFAAAQLPLGIFLDRYGPRRCESALLLIAAVGAFLFATADNLAWLIIARALIGLGVAACLMAALKAYVIWVPGERLPLINGFQLAAGGLGAVAATAPVEAALQFTDWRGVFMALAALTFLAAVAIYCIVPEREGSTSKESLGDQLRGIRTVFGSAAFWRITPLTVFSQASFIAVFGLWIGPWMRDIGGLERAAVADAVLTVAVSTIVGYVAIGWGTERLGRIGIKPLTIAIVCMVAFILVQIEIILGLSDSILVVWFLFGFFGTASVLAFPVLTLSFPSAMSGRVLTGINVLVFLLSFTFQWGVGAVIDLWPTTADGGYAPEGYTAAFSILTAVQAIAVTWFFVATWRGWGVLK